MEDLVLSCLESRVEENRNLYARFLVGPFFKGDALTVATALRRVLLSSVDSVAITALYIQGITHEFSSIVGVRESVLELSLNFQSIVLCYDKRFFQKKDFFDDVQIGYLQVQGPKVVYANDLKLPLGVKVVDPTQYIATISREGVIVLKFTLGKITNSSNQHSSFHASLPATKQAISQQLLKRNIVKAKTRCSYKKNYAVNPNLYCYSSIKKFVRAVSSTAQFIAEARSSYSAKQSFAKPLVLANSMPFGLAQRAFVYTYKHKEQNDCVKASENGASRTFAVKAENKAKSFSNVNCYAQRKSLRRPFCKKERFKENGSNHFRSNAKFCPQSFFFYRANNTKCKLIKPIKKKGYTKHTFLLANPKFDRHAYKSFCVALDGKSYKISGKAKLMAMQNKALFRSAMRSPKVLQTQIKNKNDGSMLMRCHTNLRFVSQRRSNLRFVSQRRSIAPPVTRRIVSPCPNKSLCKASLCTCTPCKSTCKTKFCVAMPSGQGECKGKSVQSEALHIFALQGQGQAQRALLLNDAYKSNCVRGPICKGKAKSKSISLKADASFSPVTIAAPSPCPKGMAIKSPICKANPSRERRFVCGNKLIENVFQSDICLHNIIPLDSSLSPVLKVNFLVEIDDEVLYLRQKVRERIILEVWTNGSIHPRQALHDATLSLLDIFSTFRSIYQTNEYSSTLLKVPEYNKRLKNN